MPPPECSLPAPGLSSGARETAPARGAPCHGDLTGGGDSMSGSARPPPLTRLALLAQRAHERRGERHRARPAHRERPRTLRPVLGEALSLPRDADAHPGRGRRLLHRRPHRSPRARSATGHGRRLVRSEPSRPSPSLFPRAQSRGRRRDPSLPPRGARRANRPSSGGRAVRPGVLLGSLRGSGRNPRRGEPRPRQGSFRARWPAGSRRSGPRGPLRERGPRGWGRDDRRAGDERVVESTLSYLADLAERPYFYLYEPPPATPWRNTKGDRRRVAIHDARELVPPPSLDVEGFLLAPHETAVGNLYDTNAVRDVYYREIAELVRKLTGATRVVAFDHNVRSASKAQRGEKGVQPPVRFPHNDY